MPCQCTFYDADWPINRGSSSDLLITSSVFPLKNLHDGTREYDRCIDKQHIAKRKACAPAPLQTDDKWNEVSQKEKLTARTQQQKRREKAQPRKITEDGPKAPAGGRGSRQRAKKRAERNRQNKQKREREALETASEKKRNRQKRPVVRATQQQRQQQRRQGRRQSKRR